MAGSCHGVRRAKEGPGQAQNGVEMLMHTAWVTHHHRPLALEQSVMGGAGITLNPKFKDNEENSTISREITGERGKFFKAKLNITTDFL